MPPSSSTPVVPSFDLDVRKRIDGIDIARAFALFGMYIVNFRSIFNAHSGSPDWLLRATDSLYGRSAALFVMLAGVGISLMAKRRNPATAITEMNSTRIRLLKRSLVLLLLGSIFLHWWPSDILHYYSAFLVIGSMMLPSSNRWLWQCSLLCIGTAIVWQAISALEYGWPPSTGLQQCSLLNITSEMLVSGCYPLFPWMVFFLIGMWLGRQNMGNGRLSRRILLWSAVAFVGSECLSALIFACGGRIRSLPEDGILFLMLTPEFFPATPLFVVSAAAGALMIVWGCVTVSFRKPEASWIRLIRPSGQFTLTLYVLHVPAAIFLHSRLSSPYEDISIITAVTAAVSFFLSSAAFAYFWKKHLPYGPLEWIMRKIS